MLQNKVRKMRDFVLQKLCFQPAITKKYGGNKQEITG